MTLGEIDRAIDGLSDRSINWVSDPSSERASDELLSRGWNGTCVTLKVKRDS